MYLYGVLIETPLSFALKNSCIFPSIIVFSIHSITDNVIKKNPISHHMLMQIYKMTNNCSRSWLVDSSRIATKIKTASASSDPSRVNWKSNPSRPCPSCCHVIDNSDVTQEWPGLPRGVKFDTSDQEIISHLLAKVGVGNVKPHPFIDEFVPTVYEEVGICYTHPQNLPGVKQDGSVSHFFHRAMKAYNTGTRKRRKIHGDDSGDVRWHKTGLTKRVILDGTQKGCKKIMVLYITSLKGGKPQKTNWVMHQYHLGTGEDEREGEFVVSKVFYQQEQAKKLEKFEQEFPEEANVGIVKVDPVTPMSVTPDPPRAETRLTIMDEEEEPPYIICTDPSLQFQHNQVENLDNEEQVTFEYPTDQNSLIAENQDSLTFDNNKNNEHQINGETNWWDSESQNLLDSQQLAEGLSLCEEFLQSQSPNRNGTENKEKNRMPSLSDYVHLGADHLKKDLEECHDFVHDPANIEIDTPPDFRLSQLEFCSQDSFLTWGGSTVVD